MKKILVPVVIALTVVNVSAKGKWDAPYVISKEESSIERNITCEKKDCVETITIPADFKDKELLNIKYRYMLPDRNTGNDEKLAKEMDDIFYRDVC